MLRDIVAGVRSAADVGVMAQVGIVPDEDVVVGVAAMFVVAAK